MSKLLQQIMNTRMLCWEDFAAKLLYQQAREEIIKRPRFDTDFTKPPPTTTPAPAPAPTPKPAPTPTPKPDTIPTTTTPPKPAPTPEPAPTTTAKPKDRCSNGNGEYMLYKPNLKWDLKKAPINYTIDVTNCNYSKANANAVYTAVINAFNLYNDGIGKKVFVHESDPSRAKINIYWAHHDNALGQLGICNYKFLPAKGELIGASIKFDSDDTWFVNPESQCGYSGSAFDIQNCAAHEVGHAVGFSHCFNDIDSTMYPTMKKGETFKGDSLDIGTLAGLKLLYN